MLESTDVRMGIGMAKEALVTVHGGDTFSEPRREGQGSLFSGSRGKVQIQRFSQKHPTSFSLSNPRTVRFQPHIDLLTLVYRR
jgi:hypothetical protein